MNDEMVFLVLFVAIIFMGTCIRGYYTRKIQKTRQRLSVKERVEEMIRAEGRICTVLFIAEAIYLITLLPLYLLFSSNLLLFQMPIPDWLRWLGVGLGFLSVPFLAWVHYVLDKGWSVTLKLQTGHKLVTNGPYRRIRHPMYTGPRNVFPFLGACFRQSLVSYLLCSRDSSYHSTDSQRRANDAGKVW
jgi:protein-S-isoprenylcysteine O-methyltransferase Ste14